MGNLNLYQKLQSMRKSLSETTLKKTGKAKDKQGGIRYEYFELSDFLPQIIRLCTDNGVTTLFNFKEDIASLKLVNNENIDEIIEFTMPVKVSQLIMCNEMQNIGGAKTFAKRYLYFDAFEIAENDDVENKSAEPGALKKIDSIKIKLIKGLIEETNSDPIQFMTWAGVDDISEITVGKFPSVIKALEDKKEKLKKGTGQ